MECFGAISWASSTITILLRYVAGCHAPWNIALSHAAIFSTERSLLFDNTRSIIVCLRRGDIFKNENDYKNENFLENEKNSQSTSSNVTTHSFKVTADWLSSTDPNLGHITTLTYFNEHLAILKSSVSLEISSAEFSCAVGLNVVCSLRERK